VDEQLYLPDSHPWKAEDFEGPGKEPEVEGRVGTLEGGAASTIGSSVEWPGEPPQAFLNSLWEGDHG